MQLYMWLTARGRKSSTPKICEMRRLGLPSEGYRTQRRRVPRIEFRRRRARQRGRRAGRGARASSDHRGEREEPAMHPSGSLVSRLLAVAAAALAAAAVAAPAVSATGHRSAQAGAPARHRAAAGTLPYQNPRLTDQAAGRGPAVADDAGREDRPDDAGRARQRRHRHVEDHDGQPREPAFGRRLGADAQHPDGMGGHGRPLSARGAGHAAAHPVDLRHRHRARRREHVRGHGVPPQHRPRRHS